MFLHRHDFKSSNQSKYHHTNACIRAQQISLFYQLFLSLFYNTRMSAKRLPFEIRVQIFQHLWNKRDLSKCSLVCKSWSDVANQLLFEEIILNGTKVFKLKKNLKDQVQDPFNGKGHFIEGLKVSVGEECYFQEIKNLIKMKTKLKIPPNINTRAPTIALD